MLARRFLWVVAGLTILFVIGGLAYRLFETQLMKFAMIPSVRFEGAPAIDREAYGRADMWIARPDIAANPSAIDGLCRVRTRALSTSFGCALMCHACDAVFGSICPINMSEA